MSFVEIMRQCFEGQLIDAGIPIPEAQIRAAQAVQKVIKRTGVRQERKLVRLAVYEARCEGASSMELEVRFNLSRATVYRYIQEELRERRAS